MDDEQQYGDYTDSSGFASAFSDFFSAARDRVQSVLPQPESSSIQSQLMDAVYQFGAGKLDQARQSLVNSFLQTGEGKKLQATATQQTVAQYTPFIILGVIALVFLGFLAGRK